MARPVSKYTKEKLEEINKKIIAYTASTRIPILKEFCYKNKIPAKHIYDFPELADSIKILIDKKEANLERDALSNKINTTMAIFSLKQLGWKDKQELEHSGKIQVHFDAAEKNV